MALRAVDGGTNWYSMFSNPFSTASTFFPIGVWYESVSAKADIDKDKDAGLNTYVVLTGNSNLSLVNSNGMRGLLQNDQWVGNSTVGSETAGWSLGDEVDMQQSPDQGYAYMQNTKAALPKDGRATYSNYGKGVMFWETDQQAARYVSVPDIVSDDIYWFTDPGVCSASEGGSRFTGGSRALTQAECRRAANYGTTVDRLRSLVSPARSKPIWNFIEDGHPFTESDAPTITGPQIRAAVWHSLIAGARGIIYFNHNFGGSCQSQHVLRDSCGTAIRPTVKATNEQVTRLAPVLNAPFADNFLTNTGNVRQMAKYQGGQFYVFAGNKDNSAATATFSAPCVGNATATVVDESRTIPIVNGSWSDSFADGNAIHIYRIDGGSQCGQS